MSESIDLKRNSRPNSLKYKKQAAQSKLVSSPVPNVKIESPTDLVTQSDAQKLLLQHQSTESFDSGCPFGSSSLVKIKTNESPTDLVAQSDAIHQSPKFFSPVPIPNGTPHDNASSSTTPLLLPQHKSTESFDSGCPSETNSSSSLVPASSRTSTDSCSSFPKFTVGSHSTVTKETPNPRRTCTTILSPCSKMNYLKTNLALKRLRKDQSTESVDSGCDSLRSSRTSLRTSGEVKTVTIIEATSEPTHDSDGDQSKQLSPTSPEPILESPTRPALITNRRVSVSRDVLADLMKAALTLENDAKPVEQLDVSDGPYTRRRKSTGDSHQPKQRARKMSSDAFYHSLVNLPKSPNQRKMSGCIVCDRKRKESASSTVIIKTTMSRKSLPTRRFSEALQVVRRSQSDIPYVELYVLKKEDLKKLRDDYFLIHKPLKERKLSSMNRLREHIIEEFVTDNLPDFCHYTNWTNILCHLVSKRLLSNTDRQKLLALPTDLERGNFFYLDILPTKGHDAYCRFYECLRGEQEHSGHADLLQNLEKALLYT